MKLNEINGESFWGKRNSNIMFFKKLIFLVVEWELLDE